MIKQHVKRLRTEEGFTLIELLVVIVILGVLAGIVVFSVSAIGDKGQSSACKSDFRAIQVAQEAFFAQGAPGVYAASTGALAPRYLTEASTLHTTAIVGATYDVENIDARCPDPSAVA